MSDKILFQLNTNFKLTNGANFEEICNCIQALTPAHLYIDENEMLRGVDDVIQIHYGQCQLLGYDNGYMLQEIDGQKRTIQVFSADLMVYLISYASVTETQESFSAENNVENVETETEDIEIPEENYLDEEVIIFPKNIDFTDFQGAENTSFETLDKNQMMEALLKLYKLESSSSEVESSSDEPEETSDEPEETSEESFENQISENSSYSTSSLESSSEVEIASNEKEKIWFRMFSKKIEDEECLEAVYINQKIFEQIEKDNDIDLKKTIELSFAAFLKKEGYPNPKISVIFYEDVYAEVYIETFFPLSNYVIHEIEEQAHLNLYSSSSEKETHDEMIFFVLRTAETYVSLSNNLNKLQQDDSDLQEDIYSDSVGLHNLPVDFVDKIMELLDYLVYKNDRIRFIYDSSEFSILNEGGGLFSVFDHELLLTVPHLEPPLYPEATNYTQLPIAQFHR